MGFIFYIIFSYFSLGYVKEKIVTLKLLPKFQNILRFINDLNQIERVFMYEQDFPRKTSLVGLMPKIYGWMSAALLVTGAVAYYVAHTPSMIEMFLKNSYMFLFLIIAQLGLVIALSAFIEKLNYATALVLFLLYSVLMGLTLSTIFLVYTTASIEVTFFITAAMFASMAIYGYFTNTDLSQVGSILIMALFGIIIASLINFFLKSSMLDTITSFIGIVVFAGLTAYDVQKFKSLSYARSDQAEKLSLIGALTLYLDFINLFLMLLRFTGKQRD